MAFTVSLLWLTNVFRLLISPLAPSLVAPAHRGLKFTSLGLRINMTNEKEELSTSMTKAYDRTLKPYHGFMIRPLFKVRSKEGL